MTSREHLRLTVALRQAEALAVLGTCPRKQVGCVILDADFTVIASGYNGAARGLRHCGCTLVNIGGRESCVRAVHAEHNAILSAARHGRRLDGAIAVSTMRPCERCAVALYQAGVVACWYDEEYEGRSELVDELVASGWRCERFRPQEPLTGCAREGLPRGVGDLGTSCQRLTNKHRADSV